MTRVRIWYIEGELGGAILCGKYPHVSHEIFRRKIQYDKPDVTPLDFVKSAEGMAK